MRNRRIIYRERVADLLERFAKGTTVGWVWDDFISVPLSDPELEQARIDCLKVQAKFPGTALSWCAADGLGEIAEIAQRVRHGTSND